MKTYRCYRRHSQCTISYRNYPNGIEELETVEAESATVAVDYVYSKYDNDKYFPHDDGTVTDHNGELSYTPGDEVVSMGDYDYCVEELC